MIESIAAIRHPDPRYHADFPALAVAANGDALLLVRRCGPWAREATFGHGRPLTFFETDAEMALYRSTDGGKSWAEESALYRGMAFDPMLCALNDGRLIAGLILGEAGCSRDRDKLHGVLHRHIPQLDTVISVRGVGLWISDDNGRTWRAGSEISVAGWEALYNLRSPVQLADDTLLMPLTFGYPWRSRYVGLFRSWDGGTSWGDPSYVAEAPAGRAHYGAGVGYWQPALACLPTGELLCICALDDRSGAQTHSSGASPAPASLMRTYSQDSGFTWSEPQPIRLEGDYPHLRLLADGRLLLTHCQRRADGGAVVAHVSEDGGLAWRQVETLNQAAGCIYHYPHTAILPDGAALTAFMVTPPDGVRYVGIVRYQLD